MSEKTLAVSGNCATIALIEVRCSCGKLLGKVQKGAAHEHKCPRCKLMVAVPQGVYLKKGDMLSFEGIDGMMKVTAVK